MRPSRICCRFCPHLRSPRDLSGPQICGAPMALSKAHDRARTGRTHRPLRRQGDDRRTGAFVRNLRERPRSPRRGRGAAGDQPQPVPESPGTRVNAKSVRPAVFLGSDLCRSHCHGPRWRGAPVRLGGFNQDGARADRDNSPRCAFDDELLRHIALRGSVKHDDDEDNEVPALWPGHRRQLSG